MAKDVASVATPVAITVKKGAAERGCTPTAEGKTITLAMDAKLIAGDYSVSIKGLETEELTATVNVAKNETLTSYSISNELIAEKLGVTTAAYFYYAALNQYGEKMVADKPNATCTLGKTVFTSSVGSPMTHSDDLASATKEGKIWVEQIPDIFGIVGSKGTVTLIDPSGTGVTATQEVVLSQKASASKCEYAGVYHVNSAKIRDNIKENDKVKEFELLLKFEDQYGHVLRASELTNLTISLAAGVTNVNLPSTYSLVDRTVDGAEYVALPLDTTTSVQAVAGDALLTITNNERGLLISQNVTVVKNVVVKSVNFTYDNGVYAGQENEIGYDIIDSEGNSVKDYATILNSIDTTKFANAGGSNINVKLERKADGTAKFILDTTNVSNPDSNSKTDQNFVPVTFTTYWNTTTGGDYLVVTKQCTMYQYRYAKTVMGIDPDTTLSYPVGLNASKKIASKKIILADQYGGKVVYGDKVNNSPIFVSALSGTSITTSNRPANAAIAVYVETNGAFEFDIVGNDMVITPSATKAGSGTVYMSLYTAGAGGADVRTGQGSEYATVDAKHYDAKFAINIYDTKEIDADSYELTVKSGWAVTETEAKTENLKSHLEVTTKVGGSKTLIPAEQYTIIDNKNNSFSTEDKNVKDVKVKTATVTVRVTTYDKVGNTIVKDISKDYTLSREDSKVYAVDSAIDSADYTLYVSTTTGAGIVTKSAFATQFTYKDQFGTGAVTSSGITSKGALIVTSGSITWGIGDLKFRADLVEGQKNECYVLNPDTTDIGIDYKNADPGKYVYKITAYAKDGKEKTFILTVRVY